MKQASPNHLNTSGQSKEFPCIPVIMIPHANCLGLGSVLSGRIKIARATGCSQNQNKPLPDVKKHMNARQLDYIKDDIIIKKLFEMLKKENPVG